MLATSKRLRSSSPPSSPLDQVTKRRRQTSSSQQGPSPIEEDPSGDEQPQWAAAGPSGWRGDVPPAAQAAFRGRPTSPWDAGGGGFHHNSPTSARPTYGSAAHTLSYPSVPSPLGLDHSPSYFPRYQPVSAAPLQQAVQGSAVQTPRAPTGGAQHDSHAHHRNAPLFHPAFGEQHPTWSSSSSLSSVRAASHPPEGMGLPGAFGAAGEDGAEGRPAITPLMGPPSLPARDALRRASIGPAASTPGDAMEEGDEENEDEDWDQVQETVHDNIDSLAASPYAGMNQLLHSLHRPRQPRPLVASSPYPHFASGPAGPQPHNTPQTPLDAAHGRPAKLVLPEQESSATRRRYGEVNRQLGELVLGRRAGRGLEDGEGG